MTCGFCILICIAVLRQKLVFCSIRIAELLTRRGERFSQSYHKQLLAVTVTLSGLVRVMVYSLPKEFFCLGSYPTLPLPVPFTRTLVPYPEMRVPCHCVCIAIWRLCCTFCIYSSTVRPFECGSLDSLKNSITWLNLIVFAFLYRRRTSENQICNKYILEFVMGSRHRETLRQGHSNFCTFPIYPLPLPLPFILKINS